MSPAPLSLVALSERAAAIVAGSWRSEPARAAGPGLGSGAQPPSSGRPAVPIPALAGAWLASRREQHDASTRQADLRGSGGRRDLRRHAHRPRRHDTAQAAPAAGPLPANLVPVATRHSLLGTHVWYRQTFHGLPVLGSYYVRHFANNGQLTAVADGRRGRPRHAEHRARRCRPPTRCAAPARPSRPRRRRPPRPRPAQVAKNVELVPAFGASHATLSRSSGRPVGRAGVGRHLRLQLR